MTVHVIDFELAKLLAGPGVVAEMGRLAEKVAADIHAPAKFEVFHHAGRGPRGPFGQAGIRGDGALAVEFGTSRTPPHAPVRNALARQVR